MVIIHQHELAKTGKHINGDLGTLYAVVSICTKEEADSHHH